MFRITEDPSSGSLVQCLAKNYKNDSIVSVGMDMVGVMAAEAVITPTTSIPTDTCIHRGQNKFLCILSKLLFRRQDNICITDKCFSLAQQTLVVQGCLVIVASRSHSRHATLGNTPLEE